MSEEAVIEVPLTVPCTTMWSPTATLERVEVACPFSIVAFDASTLYEAVPLFTTVNVEPLIAETVPPTTGCPLPCMTGFFDRPFGPPYTQSMPEAQPS